MRIVHTAQGPAVTGIDDLTSLDVLVPTDADAVRSHDWLHPLGTVDGAHAWLDVDQLRAHGRPDDEGWSARFAGMIAYAASQGWVDPSGARVRAHLTQSG